MSATDVAWSLAGAPWAIVGYRGAGDEPPRAGALRPDGAVVDLGDGVLALLHRWDEIAGELRDFDPYAAGVVPDARLDLVLRYPSKVICAGANYRGHLQEMGVPLPTPDVEPYFFLKPPSTALLAPGAAIPVHGNGAAQLDWEAELGVVIGRRATAVRPEEALDVVAGYVVLNDVTDRAALRRRAPLAPPFAFDWLSAKGFDGSCPIGPGIVPAFHVPDPHALRVRTWVNDVLKQDASTGDMVYDIPTLIVAVSRTLTLEPGDVLATGTPAGVGAPRGDRLEPGDVVRVEIESIGAVANPVGTRP